MQIGCAPTATKHHRKNQTPNSTAITRSIGEWKNSQKLLSRGEKDDKKNKPGIHQYKYLPTHPLNINFSHSWFMTAPRQKNVCVWTCPDQKRLNSPPPALPAHKATTANHSDTPYGTTTGQGDYPLTDHEHTVTPSHKLQKTSTKNSISIYLLSSSATPGTGRLLRPPFLDLPSLKLSLLGLQGV